jgi:hypothetical protein
VQLEDEFENPITGGSSLLSISVAGANQASSLAVTELDNGSYTASYTPIIAGTDHVAVQVNGAAVPGSPFLSLIAAGPADPATTTALVTSRFQFFFWTIDVVVTTRDAQGNLLGRGGDLVAVNDGTPRDVRDNGDGTYLTSFGTFLPTTPIAITLNGVPIQGSPFIPEAR